MAISMMPFMNDSAFFGESRVMYRVIACVSMYRVIACVSRAFLPKFKAPTTLPSIKAPGTSKTLPHIPRVKAKELVQETSSAYNDVLPYLLSLTWDSRRFNLPGEHEKLIQAVASCKYIFTGRSPRKKPRLH